MVLSDPPARHELDDLFSIACSEAIACGWLVVTNPLPANAIARARGKRTTKAIARTGPEDVVQAIVALIENGPWPASSSPRRRSAPEAVC
jgi:hypothetical protein